MTKLLGTYGMKYAGVLLVASLLCFLFITWMASGSLVSPSRRALQDYHQSWLKTPENHGVKISRFYSDETSCPCLIVEPSGDISERGAVLREQVSDLSLPLFGEIRANLVMFHGRNGRKEDLLPIAERFCAVGFRCILIDLPAHGENQQENTYYGAGERDGFIAQQVLDEVINEKGFPVQPSYLWGMSMGGSYAARSLYEDSDFWQSAVIVCSFDHLSHVVDGKLGKLPRVLKGISSKMVNVFTRHRSGFDYTTAQPALWATKVTTPVMVVHGTDDQLISMEQGRSLYESYQSSQKRWLEVPNAGHNDILVTPMPLYSEMVRWYFVSPE